MREGTPFPGGVAADLQMNSKQWHIAEPRGEHGREIKEIADSLGLHTVTAALLWNRGQHDAESAKRFLRLEEEMLYDSFLMRDMREAVNRIIAAIDSGERTTIYGDYDVDGVTAVSALYLYLRDKGANVDYYIPNRVGEGYGVSEGVLDILAGAGTKLIVTVDTGITAVEEAVYAASIGIDMVITDHHECHGELPAVCAAINPRRPDCPYPFKELAGVGVVFKLICALEQILRERAGEALNDGRSSFLRDMCLRYGDLVAIGTVADVMPLVDENRLIVSIGMKLVEETKRPGLAALMELADPGDTRGRSSPKRRRVTSSMIGYTIAPRINAAGRLDSAERAVELFLAESDAKAREIAEELCDINRSRQTEENTIVAEVYRKIEAEHDFTHDRVIVLDETGWHHGVIGIVASRVTEHYYLPSILISFDGETGIGKGSGRSIKGLDLVEALKSCSDCLTKFGGHELAAGLSIERDRLEEFKRRINEYARENLNEDNLVTTLNIDCELEPDELTLDIAGELYRLEPYGVANPVPLFVLRDAVIGEIVPIGNNRHTRMTLRCGEQAFTAVYFRRTPEDLGYTAGDAVDTVFNLNINEFQNRKTVQMIVRDMRYAGSYYEQLTEQTEIYDAFTEGKRDAEVPAIYIPDRDDFVNIYLYLRGESEKGREKYNLTALDRQLCGVRAAAAGREVSRYAKLRFMLDIMQETGLITVTRKSDDCYNIRLVEVKGKIDLERSEIYTRLRAGRGGSQRRLKAD